MVLTHDDLLALRYARALLENPSFATRAVNRTGKALEKILSQFLPGRVQTAVTRITRKSLERVLYIALYTMKNEVRKPSREATHRIAVIATGIIGGFFGLPGLTIELPISTSIIFRSIADIARSQGEQLSDPEARLACLEVFALGGGSDSGNEVESFYFAVRGALAKYVSDSAAYMARTEFAQGGPAFVRFVSQVACRFGIPVSEKVATQTIPAIGAVGGGVINGLFIHHFQDVARGHFIVRRLERKYGPQFIRNEYMKL